MPNQPLDVYLCAFRAALQQCLRRLVEAIPNRCYGWGQPSAVADGRCATPEDNELSFNSEAASAANVEPLMTAQQNVTSEDILALVLSSLDDDKAEDVVEIPLRGKTEVADYMVIASGRSTRQVAAISEKLVERLKEKFGILCKVEGAEIGDWVLVDAADILVHVFRPEVREFYNLEKMWLPTGATAADN